MASEKPAKPAEPAPEGEAPKKGGKKTILVAAVVLLLEGATVAVTMVMAGGPRRAVADVPTPAPKEAVEKDAEVKIIEAKLPNSREGHLYLYDLQIVAKVGEKNKEKVTELFSERDAQIRDHIRTVIAGFDPKSLTEPGLETLRRQVSYQLEQDVGKDLVKEVLIPKCTPIRMDY
jgi:flagellar basal body-associated protein FliL